MAADPQWLRSSLCEDLARMDRAAGTIPDTRAIERTVDRDLQRWAAEQRDPPPERAAPERPDERRHAAVNRAAEDAKGDVLQDFRFACRDNVADEKPRRACPCGGACRSCRLHRRILALMEPLPLEERRHVGPEVWLNCRYPGWAREVIRTWQWMVFSPGAMLLREKKELERVVVRKLEDIADRSTAVIGLGGWA